MPSDHQNGVYYTPYSIIRRVIDDLFLNDLRDRLNACQTVDDYLAYCAHLSQQRFLEPACGDGGFLTVTYEIIKGLEYEGLKRLKSLDNTKLAEVKEFFTADNLFGIELQPAAANKAIANINALVPKYNEALRNLGIEASLLIDGVPTIAIGSALAIDWAEVLPPSDCSYILGNPPFVAATNRTEAQLAEISAIAKDFTLGTRLDYCAMWFIKAASYIKLNHTVKAAFVATKSIIQGEQAIVLWPPLFKDGLKIYFAHRPFQWRNAGRGVANITCAIIGISQRSSNACVLYDYGANHRAAPLKKEVKHINHYLQADLKVVLHARKRPLSAELTICSGADPADNGGLQLTEDEKNQLLAQEPAIKKWLRKYLGDSDLLNNRTRWCLWFVKHGKSITPAELAALKGLQPRLAKIKTFRMACKRKELVDSPHLFSRRPEAVSDYLAIPVISSENRKYIPMAFKKAAVISGTQNFFIERATNYHFGILSSVMHNAWVRPFCSRLGKGLRYSNLIIYNNFVWPKATLKQKEAIEAAAQAVLDARKADGGTLLKLYSKDMPAGLKEAHDRLDKAVDAAYGYTGADNNDARVEFLLTLYNKLIAAE